MDIAKIRKMAKEREAAGKPPEPAPEQQAAEIPEPAAAPEPAAEEERGGGGDTAPPAAAPAAAPAAPAEEEHGKGVIELLTFTLAQEEFAFRVPEVEEIIRHQRITRVPTMPGYVCGITSLRGKIIPVIDLKARLILRQGASGPAGGTEDDGSARGGKILILAGPRGLIGATIDRVLGVVRFPEGSVFEPPAHLTEEETQYIEGVVTVEKRFISIIRAEAALTIEVS